MIDILRFTDDANSKTMKRQFETSSMHGIQRSNTGI